ncbi:MAG: ABC transporter substrate-binding protein [Clostridia bacterium]|nr:ABC transporter substrate-binding protein [Clostridia bacterium]MBR5767246.1 ABC transporter substrate-binding protein [Clostridia bacterium]
MKKTTSFLLVLITLFCSVTAFTSCADKQSAVETVTVTDMLAETVEVKKNPQKVACVSRTTYDLLIAFGLGDCIDGVYYSLLENEWAGVFDKDAASRYSCQYEESYETFLSRGVDIVFAPEKYIADALKEHGIKALNVSLYGNPTFDQYVYFFADLVKQIWDSEDVARRVDAWKAHMSDTVSGIQTELAKHNDAARTVYYVRGDKNKGIGYTDTGKSFVEYAYCVLGMKYTGSDFSSTKPSAEEICKINPDVFVIGGIYQKTLENILRTEEPYVHLDAVKENRIYNIPIGLTMFEQLSVFSPVFLCDQANKLYPEYFHFDVQKMIRDYSLEFFGVTLTDDEINNMLNGYSRSGGLLAQ